MAFSEREKPDYYTSEEIDQAVFKFLRDGEKPPSTMGKVKDNVFELSQAEIIPREVKKPRGSISVFLARAVRLARS